MLKWILDTCYGDVKLFKPATGRMNWRLLLTLPRTFRFCITMKFINQRNIYMKNIKFFMSFIQGKSDPILPDLTWSRYNITVYFTTGKLHNLQQFLNLAHTQDSAVVSLSLLPFLCPQIYLYVFQVTTSFKFSLLKFYTQL